MPAAGLAEMERVHVSRALVSNREQLDSFERNAVRLLGSERATCGVFYTSSYISLRGNLLQTFLGKSFLPEAVGTTYLSNDVVLQTVLQGERSVELSLLRLLPTCEMSLQNETQPPQEAARKRARHLSTAISLQPSAPQRPVASDS
eukprot:3936105-Rhodomonas_salina.2